jgi:hypothetical protein
MVAYAWYFLGVWSPPELIVNAYFGITLVNSTFLGNVEKES